MLYHTCMCYFYVQGSFMAHVYVHCSELTNLALDRFYVVSFLVSLMSMAAWIYC